MSGSPSLKAAPALADWLSFEGDEVQLRTGKVEIGQRVGPALVAIVAEELRIPRDRIRLMPVRTGESPDEGYTSGSNSLQHSGEALRLAAATAFARLRTAAARQLGVDEASLRIEESVFRSPDSNASVSPWALAPAALAGVEVDPLAVTVAPGALEEVGRPARPPSLPDMLRGAFVYLQDLRLDGLWHARVVRPPRYAASLVSAPAAAPEGTVLIRDGSFLAVAGEDEYRVLCAARRIAGQARWAGEPVAVPEALETALLTGPRRSLPVVDGTPVDAPLPAPEPPPPSAVTTLEARYLRPYQMHASIGPSAAAAHFEDGVLTVYSHTQGVYPLKDSLAEVFGLPPEQVQVEHVPGPGCYGHNGADDAALDAALVARAVPGRPVLLKWTREDEHAWEPYAPAMLVTVRASLDAEGRIVDWRHDSYGDTHRARPRPGPGGVGPSRLLAATHLEHPAAPYVPTPNMARHAGLHRNADPIYAFPRRSIGKHLVAGLPLRTSAMRTLGAFTNVIAIEGFMDELAAASDQDPVQFRLRHLDDPRARDVLERAARALPPGADPGAGRGSGLAVAQYKNAQAYAAVSVQLRVGEDARIRLERMVVVADAGRVVDPDGLAAQLEGGALQAASWALLEEVRFDATGILSRDWEGYPILRFEDVPEIEVLLVDRPDRPTLGAGECASGPAGAAIVNAVHAATGLRVRRLPLTPERLREAALAS